MKELHFAKWQAVVGVILLAWLVVSCASQQPSPAPAQTAKPSATEVSNPAKPVEAPKAEPKPAAKVEEVKVGIPTKSLSVLPLFVGVEAGLFKQEGLDAKFIVIGPTPSIPALAAGDIDFVTVAGTAFRAAATGMPVKVLAFTANKPIFDLMVKPEFGSVKELKGKTLAISSRGSNVEYVTRDILKFYGVDPDKEVTLLPAGTVANALAALQSGSVDGSLLTAPENAMAKKIGFKRLDYDDSIVGEQIQSGIVSSEKRLKENPELIKKMLRATVKSVRYTIDHRPEALKTMVKDLEMQADLIEGSYDSFVKSYSRNGTIGEAAIKAEIERTKQETQIKEDVPMSKVVDVSFLNDVLKDVGRQ